MQQPATAAHPAPRRILIITTWKDDGHWYFLNRLRALGMHVDLLEPPSAGLSWLPARLGRFLASRSSLYQCIQALLRAQRYDIIVTWNTRAGTTLGVLARLLPKRMRPRHILRDFHLDLTRFASPLYFLRVLLVRLAAPCVHSFLTTSRHEADLYARMFHIPQEAIRFFPDTAGGIYLDAEMPCAVSDYVFAFGNSDRDFDTFLEAAPAIPRPMILLSQNYTPSAPLPANVTRIAQRLPIKELKELIGCAAVVVIPVKSHFVAAGQNAMLEVMCLARPLVVTTNLTTLEHATHEHDALFIPPRDPGALARAVNRLLEDPLLASRLGECARHTATALPEEQVQIFIEEIDRLFRQKTP